MIEEKLITKISSEIRSQKEAIFMEAYKKKTGKNFDISLEKNNRFPSIRVDFDGQGLERFYANDGSPNGILIITFYPPEYKFSKE